MFYLRNHDVNLVRAKFIKFDDSANLVVEAKEICEGLQCCFDKGFSDIIVESD